MTTNTEKNTDNLETVEKPGTLANKILDRIEKEKKEKEKKEGQLILAKTIMESLGVSEVEALKIVKQEEKELDNEINTKESVKRGFEILKSIGIILPTVISVDYWNKIEKIQGNTKDTQIEKLIDIIKILDTSKTPHGVTGANIKKLDFKQFQDINEAVEKEMKKSQDKKK